MTKDKSIPQFRINGRSYLFAADAADVLGVSLSTVQKAAKDKNEKTGAFRLPSLKQGRRLYILTAALGGFEVKPRGRKPVKNSATGRK